MEFESCIRNGRLLAGLLLAGACQAGTMYTDLSPNDAYVYNCTCGWGIGYNGGAGSAVGWVAAPFTPSWSGALTDIQLAMQWFYGPNNITIDLVNDNSGSPGTDVLESWSMQVLTGWQGYNNPNMTAPMGTQQTLTSTSGVDLSEGIQYWVLAQPDTNGDNYFVWMPTDLALQAYTPDSPAVQCALGCGSNSDQSAPALQVDATPEPGAAGLATAGLALLACGLRGRAWRLRLHSVSICASQGRRGHADGRSSKASAGGS